MGGGVGLRPSSSLSHNPLLRSLLASNLLFYTGIWTQSLILGWMVYDLTGSELQLAVFTAIRMSPLLLGPLAGALADRFDRLAMLGIATGWAVCSLVALAAMVSLGVGTFPVLVAGGFALGLAHSPSQPPRAALVSELVEPRRLGNAMALISLILSSTMMIGPAIGGALITWVGAPVALWVTVVFYAASFVLLFRLRGREVMIRRPAGSLLSLMFIGAGELIRLRVVVAVLIVTVMANASMWSLQQGFMPVFARQSLGLDAAGLGGLLTAFGLGAIVSSLGIALFEDVPRKGIVFLVGTGVCAAFWAAFTLTSEPVAAFVLLVLAGLASAPFGALQAALMLQATPSALQGRAMGMQSLAIGVTPLASLVLGAVAQVLGMPLTGFVSLVLLIVSLVIVALAIPELIRSEAPNIH